MNSSMDPMDIFRPSCARPVEEKWHPRHSWMWERTHNAIRWINDFFFLRPSDGVRVSLTPLETEEGYSHRNRNLWRVLGIAEDSQSNTVLPTEPDNRDFQPTQELSSRTASERVSTENTKDINRPIRLEPLRLSK
jgi:hypothetical protein